MAKISGQAKVLFELTVTLTESEARAIDALVGYGDDAFIEKFKKDLGEYYLRDYEQGLRDFFKSMRQIVPGHLSRVDAARKEFQKA